MRIASQYESRQGTLPGEGGRPMLWEAHWPKTGIAGANHGKPILVFCHGFKGFKDWGAFPLMVPELVAAGFAVFRFNFSHNGTTPESPTEFVDLEAFSRNTVRFELEDLGRVIDYLHTPESPFPAESADPARLGLFGHSRGGGIVLLRASEDPRVKAVATLAAISTFHRFSDAEVAAWERAGVLHVPNARTGQQMPLLWETVLDYRAHEQRLKLPHRGGAIKQPTLLVHGTEDTSVPIDEMHALANHITHAEKITMEGADHGFGATHPWEKDTMPRDTKTAIRHIERFFRNVL